MPLWWYKDFNKTWPPRKPYCTNCPTKPKLRELGDEDFLKCPVCKRIYDMDNNSISKEKFKRDRELHRAFGKGKPSN